MPLRPPVRTASVHTFAKEINGLNPSAVSTTLASWVSPVVNSAGTGRARAGGLIIRYDVLGSWPRGARSMVGGGTSRATNKEEDTHMLLSCSRS